MTTLDHRTAAELLFASGQTPDTTRAAVRAIIHEYRLHPDVQHAAGVLAAEYGEHWETAHARMAACLRIVPGRIELPDGLTPAALALIGCETDDCTNPGPYVLIDKRLHCVLCGAAALLAETAGPDGDDLEVTGRG